MAGYKIDKIKINDMLDERDIIEQRLDAIKAELDCVREELGNPRLNTKQLRRLLEKFEAKMSKQKK